MPRLRQIISDTFTRADGTLGANYSDLDAAGGWDVVSNQARGRTAAVDNLSVYSGASWTSPANHYSRVQVKAAGVGDGGPLVCGGTGQESGYFFDIASINSTTARVIQRANNGTYATIWTTPSVTINADDYISIAYIDGYVAVYVNDVYLDHVMDSVLVGNSRAGFYSYHNELYLANFTAGAVQPHTLASLGAY